MTILFDYIEKHKLLITKWTGDFSLTEYQKSVHLFEPICKKHNIQNIIHCISNIEYPEDANNYNIDIIKKVAKIRIESFSYNYKVVIITNKPKDVVYTHLYVKELNMQNKYHYCSTMEKAQKLLSISDPLLNLPLRFGSLEYNLKHLIQ